MTAPLHQVLGRRTTTRPMTPLLQTAPKPRSSSSSRRQHLRHLPQPQVLWRLAAVLVLVHRVTPALHGAPQHRRHLQRGQGQGLQQQTAQHSQVLRGRRRYSSCHSSGSSSKCHNSRNNSSSLAGGRWECQPHLLAPRNHHNSSHLRARHGACLSRLCRARGHSSRRSRLFRPPTPLVSRDQQQQGAGVVRQQERQPHRQTGHTASLAAT